MNAPVKVGALAALAALSLGALACADASDGLKLSVTSGKAPLAVSIVGPKRVTDLGRGTLAKWVGCGFDVDWHDDSPPRPNPTKACARYLEHVFAKPGSYTVKVDVIRVNPDDSHGVDWTGSATVVVR
ncbi:MAG TPA: hypothetical protein VHB21_00235 [Minicystis sp.]|nr:hypothetical protein [Minicystis sp.]